MRRTPVVLLAIGVLIGVGVSAAPRAEADCHTVDPAVKALRKKAAAFGKEMTATVRAAILGLKKEGKVLAQQVRKGTMEPEAAYDSWIFKAKDTFDTCVEAVDETHDLTLAEFESMMLDAGIDSKAARELYRELQAGCGGAADMLHERTRDCLETVRDGLGCNGAFKPLQAALHCEEFDINWQALELRDPLPLMQMKNLGGASTPVFLRGAPVVAAATCQGNFSLVVLAGESSRVVQVYANTEDANMELGEPLAEYVLTADDGATEIVEFEGLPASDEPYYYRITSVAKQGSSAQAFNRDVESFQVPAWSAEPAACTVTDVHLTVDGVEEVLGPWSSVLVEKNAAGEVTQVWVTFLQSGPEDSFEFFFEPSTPVDPATETVNPTDPPDVFYAHTSTWISIIIEAIEIRQIGNLLQTAPDKLCTIDFSGYSLDGVSGTHHPTTGRICLKGANAAVSTVP